MANEWHPDKCEHPDAKERFQLIQEVYETLSDPAKRAEYDARHRRKPKPTVTVRKPEWLRFTLSELIRGEGQCAKTMKRYKLNKLKFGDHVTVNGRDYVVGRDYAHDKYPHFELINDEGDLQVSANVSTLEALVGAKLTIKHPDGFEYNGNLAAGVTDGKVYRYKGLGLHGADLLVTINIYTPSLTKSVKQRILNLLNKTTVEI